MEIVKRKENPLLKRVELHFCWEHSNGATPTLAEMVTAAAKAEPGSKRELTFVKNVNTRFGRPQTTGVALIYADSESATLEPNYVHTRHKSLHGSKKAENTEGGGE
ncbi:MAG TPA: hypothetical protein QGF70_05125 [Candidatus Thalassarchaeaceae archaeon]|nr:hypothetical protein [Candidatus Thalassarchaeaceae archaeon]